MVTNPDTLKTKTGMIGCSGTFITPFTVLTAAHCFPDTSVGLWIRDYDHHSFEAKLIKLNPGHDLALLAIVIPATTKPHHYAILAASATVGESVLNVGSPLGLEFLVSDGIVSSVNVVLKPFLSKYMLTTAMINSGSSGGGAFNDQGELIGVNTMTIGGMFSWAGISAAVSIEDVREFLR